jgi:putative FmdB family regulatory protein
MSMSDGSEMLGNTNGGATMPFYEFACEDCHKQFSLVLSLKERESGQVTCPGCGSTKVTPLISSFMVKTSKKS